MLNRREQKRLTVLNLVREGELKVEEAARVLGLSPRHVYRLKAAYGKEGAAALAHGNRGRRPGHALPVELGGKVLDLARNTYQGCNHQHLTELLAEREGIILSRSSVRRILLAAGLRSPRRRRPPKHRSRRERYPQEGMLLQIDGSRHDWLEGRGPWLTLVGAIDDATGEVPYGLFRGQEDAQGYFLLLGEIVRTKGIPQSLYCDRHAIFQRNPREPESLEEQLAGRRQPTQFGRLLEELAIQPIFALSPQAKGRIERLWGTFQDRLVSELRLAGACTLEEANQVLAHFLPRFNRRFAVPASQSGSAYRGVGPDFEPEAIFCFKYRRRVAADNTVRLGEHRLQLLPGSHRISYAQASVEVHERLDGSLAVYYQGRCLATQPAPRETPVLRARQGRALPALAGPHPQTTATPNREEAAVVGGVDKWTALPPAHLSTPHPDHPWRRPLRVTKSLNN